MAIDASGKVIAGEYKGCWVFDDSQSSNSLFARDSWHPQLILYKKETRPNGYWKDRNKQQDQADTLAEINKETAVSIEVTPSRPEITEASESIFRQVIGRVKSEKGKKQLYDVKVVFRDGKTSVLQIEQSVLDVVQNIAYEILEASFAVDKSPEETAIKGEKTGTPASNARNTGIQNSAIRVNPDNIEPTITRIELFLEDGDWEKVRAYCETALDYFPTDYRLYLYLLFADCEVTDLDSLAESGISFRDNTYYKKAIRFAGDNEIAEKLK